MQDKIIKCRLNDKMYKDVVKYCSENQITISQYIRNCVSFSLKCALKKYGGNFREVSAEEWFDNYYKEYMEEYEKEGGSS